MYWISKTFHLLNRSRRRLLILFAVLGPGIITMVADNDAGGISTYAVTGSKYGFSLLWIFFILVPMAYYIQEMTVVDKQDRLIGVIRYNDVMQASD